MKNATPSDIAIKNILKDIDELISYAKDFIKAGHNDASVFLAENGGLVSKFDMVTEALQQLKILGYLTESQFTKIKNHFYIKDDVISDALLNISTDYLNTNKGGHIADIVERIFPQTESNLFIERMLELKKEIENTLSKQEKTKGIVKGLRGDFSWRRITIYLKGEEVDICEDNRNLGEYTLDKLGISKPKGKSNVRGFFIGLFVDDERTGILLASKKNNKNQALKKRLTAILCNAFDKNIDPIEIDEYHNYAPIFKAKLGGELRSNDHPSGKKLPKEYE